ncbi:MAG: hypothetical protein SNH88_03065 [Rikenellaceae bacterium]
MKRNIIYILLLGILSTSIVSCTETIEAMDENYPEENLSPEEEEDETEDDEEVDDEDDENVEENEGNEDEDGEEEDKENDKDEDNLYPDAKYATVDFSTNNLVSSKTADQSAKLQAIFDEYSAQGGGYLILPAGEYAFINVYMRSNIHLKVDEGATLYPYYSSSLSRNANGELPIGNMLTFAQSTNTSSAEYIEDCSISSLNGGRYTVDFRDIEYGVLQQVRFIVCRMVRNFQISDFNIEDNCTKYCALIFSPSMDQSCASWAVSRPTDGIVKNCSTFNAASGYGLMQFHGALRLEFDNLYAEGGVAFRLEPDITGSTHGIYDLKATNISAKNARAAVMFSPHTATNGTITIDGVRAESCSFGVLINAGFIDSDNTNNPDAILGSYANDSSVSNIHIIYGTKGQSDAQQIYAMTPDDDKYALFEHCYYGDPSSTLTYVGPSLAAIFDTTGYYDATNTAISYLVTCTNITSEGFPDHENSVLYDWEIADRYSSRWSIVNSLPCNL